VSSIRANGLVKRFGTVVALDGIDLDVGAGEIVALLGPNGAGKSTLLRILGTTVLADAGRATVMGYDVALDAIAVRRSTGLMIGDERSWYWRLTGRHNLEFFAALHGLRRPAARARAQQLLGEVGLEQAADRRFAGYSSGMRARLSLARALISEPPVLLLDEPTQNLDPVAAARFRETVLELAEERGTGVLFATHDLHEAAEIATRVIGLARGRVAFVREGGTDARELEEAIVGSVKA
jgi:ABC-type multidrug transport system ATPase subunit